MQLKKMLRCQKYGATLLCEDGLNAMFLSSRHSLSTFAPAEVHTYGSLSFFRYASLTAEVRPTRLHL